VKGIGSSRSPVVFSSHLCRREAQPGLAGMPKARDFAQQGSGVKANAESVKIYDGAMGRSLTQIEFGGNVITLVSRRMYGERKPGAPRVRKILVVDDEVLLRTMMCDGLEAAGHSVLRASSGEEACRW